MITKNDMRLVKEKFLFTDPRELPISFFYGPKQYEGRTFIKGLPETFKTETVVEQQENIRIYRHKGIDEKGLLVEVECKEYLDFPVIEYVAFVTNTSDKISDVISSLRVFNREIEGENPEFISSNGELICDIRGNEFTTHSVISPMHLSPIDGTACHGACPFMKLNFKDFRTKIAVGWPAVWYAEVRPSDKQKNATVFELGQKRCVIKLEPNETIRTPSVTFMAYEGDENKGINLWRRFYFAHIIPKQNGKPLSSKIALGATNPKYEEWCGATEKQQLEAINWYTENGLKPDLWWIDAGWYECNYSWPHTGTWVPNPKHFPNGLRSIGEKCSEIGSDFLLWFEPEKICSNSDTARKHPEWLLGVSEVFWEEQYEFALLNLGNKECVEWITDEIDRVIKENGVTVYRQDFNFDPLPVWIKNETYYRTGALENAHVQGYLKFWDNLLERNPHLLIDTCASGGRRNEMETLRRAVPLHYTDVGYGLHTIKQSQFRFLNEWTPYYRSHVVDWRDENNDYSIYSCCQSDEFTLVNSLAPVIDMSCKGNEIRRDLMLGAVSWWRKAAQIMINGDFYPLTECKKSTKDIYAMQFEDAKNRCGFIQIINNVDSDEENIVLYPNLIENCEYIFTHYKNESQIKINSPWKDKSFKTTVTKASAEIWFYEY